MCSPKCLSSTILLLSVVQFIIQAHEFKRGRKVCRSPLHQSHLVLFSPRPHILKYFVHVVLCTPVVHTLSLSLYSLFQLQYAVLDPATVR